MSGANVESVSELARTDAAHDIFEAACEDRKKSRQQIMQSLRSHLAALSLHLDDFDELTVYAAKHLNARTVKQSHLAGLEDEIKRLKAQIVTLKRKKQDNAELQQKYDNLQGYVETLKTWGRDWEKTAAARDEQIKQLTAAQRQRGLTADEIEQAAANWDELVRLRKMNLAAAERIVERDRALREALKEVAHWQVYAAAAEARLKSQLTSSWALNNKHE
jgi:hypothetical protein